MEVGEWGLHAPHWYKRTIADAAVDGAIPLDEDLRIPTQVTRDLMAWLRRLDEQEEQAA